MHKGRLVTAALWFWGPRGALRSAIFARRFRDPHFGRARVIARRDEGAGGLVLLGGEIARLRPRLVIANMKRWTARELDLRREAASASAPVSPAPGSGVWSEGLLVPCCTLGCARSAPPASGCSSTSAPRVLVTMALPFELKKTGNAALCHTLVHKRTASALRQQPRAMRWQARFARAWRARARSAQVVSARALTAALRRSRL